MMAETEFTHRPPDIFIVNGAMRYLDTIKDWLTEEGFRLHVFAGVDAFLDWCAASTGSPRSGCLLLAVRTPGGDGLRLLQTLLGGDVQVPVVVIAENADIPTAVAAMKAGAVDFLEAPVNRNALLKSVRQAVDHSIVTGSLQRRRSEILQRYERLSHREREVLDGLVAGYLPKQIALELGTHPSTVRKQRASILRKLEAATTADLIQMIWLARASNHSSD